MKSLITKLSILITIFAMMSTAALAEVLTGSCGDNVIYTIDIDSGTLTIEGEGYMSNFSTRDINGHLVSDAPWGEYYDRLTRLTIKKGVVSIGSFAFYGCSSLTSVSLHDDFDNLGWWAFVGCTGLAEPIMNKWFFMYMPAGYEGEYTIPNNQTIVRGAFNDCKALYALTLPEGTTCIDNYAFENCKSLRVVTIPASVNSIGGGAFWGCRNLSAIYNLSPTAQPFNGSSVFDSYNDATLHVPSNAIASYEGSGYWNTLPIVADLDSNRRLSAGACGEKVSYALYDDGELVISGKGEITDELSAFPWGTSKDAIKRIKINEGIIAISNTFFDYPSLTDVSLPAGLLKIRGWAFQRCQALTSINIPSSVFSIGEGVFAECNNLSSLSLAADNQYYSVEDGVIYNYDKTELVTCLASKQGSFVVPYTVRSINSSAFYGCSELESITIPSNVREIGSNAFRDCSKLTEISLPEGITEIPWNAFGFCSNLKEIAVPATVTTIHDYAFSRCYNLTAIKLPRGLTTIGEGAFCDDYSLSTIDIPAKVRKLGSWAFSNCTELSTINSYSKTPQLLAESDQVFFNVRATLHVPTGSETAYASAPGWKDFNIVPDLQVRKKGDVNGDGEISVSDLVSTIYFSLGNSPLDTKREVADMNDDGKINTIDINAVATHILDPWLNQAEGAKIDSIVYFLPNYVEGSDTYFFSNGSMLSVTEDSHFGYSMFIGYLDIDADQWIEDESFAMYCDTQYRPIMAVSSRGSLQFTYNDANATFSVLLTDSRGATYTISDISLQDTAVFSTRSAGETRASTNGNWRDGPNKALFILDLTDAAIRRDYKKMGLTFVPNIIPEGIPRDIAQIVISLLPGKNVFGKAPGYIGLAFAYSQLLADLCDWKVKQEIGDVTPLITALNQSGKGTVDMRVEFRGDGFYSNQKDEPFYHIEYWQENELGRRITGTLHRTVPEVAQYGFSTHHISGLNGGRWAFQVRVYPRSWSHSDLLVNIYNFESNIMRVDISNLYIKELEQSSVVLNDEITTVSMHALLDFTSNEDKTILQYGSSEYGLYMKRGDKKTELYSAKENGGLVFDINIDFWEYELVINKATYEAKPRENIEFGIYITDGYGITRYYDNQIADITFDYLRAQLEEFYYSANGENWTRNDNWCTDEPIDTWYGVSQNFDYSSNRSMIALSLGQNNLGGNAKLIECQALLALECEENQLTTLDVSGCQALLGLNCEKNQLTTLDVSGCQALAELSCVENQLTTLNVSGCQALSVLWCEKNRLTTLDVSECQTLSRLKCFENQLTTLNVSGCQALAELSCVENRLTTLDLSGCQALAKLWCGRNQLTTLVLSECSALLELWCEKNQLTTLDVSDCQSLKELWCPMNLLGTLDLSECQALLYLDCNENQLTSLNVSECSALLELNCEENQLTSLNVSGCSALLELNCEENQLSNLNVSNCVALRGLYCAENQLTSLNIKGCTALQFLQCCYNSLSSLDISECKALTGLNCHHNRINQEFPAVFYGHTDSFIYDHKYTYHYNYIFDIWEWTENEYGWWYPGEPNSPHF